MQRRNVNAQTSSASPFSSGASPQRMGQRHRSSGVSKRSEPLGASVLLLIALLLTLATYMFPSEVSEVETELGKDIRAVEHELEQMWHREATMTKEEKRALQQAASQRMLEQDSKWVDGEKKLKSKLKVLAERQKEGKDLGAPVLTRWLGDDIPAWVGEGVNEEEWRKKVDAKYEEMRVEEQEWRKKMQALLDEEEKQKKKRG